MIIFPNAKINIGLNIVEKRNDGFHNIETVFYPISLRDILEVIENKKYNIGEEKVLFTSSGNIIPSDGKDNLSVKAYKLLSEKYKLPPVKIHLHKIIPTGAGLGGGSADAAFMIKLLNTKFELNIGEEEQIEFAKKLGSDCAFFINNKPIYATEKGDVFQDIQISLSGYYLVLVYPPVHVSTADAYAGVVPQKAKSNLQLDIKRDISEWRGLVKNDFEKSIFNKYPVIEEVKNNLYKLGASYASMSGSGSSVFGIFKNEIDTENYFKDCFVWKEKLLLSNSN